MRLVVFGSTGGTGREIVAQALARGHDVTAFARDPSKLGPPRERLFVVKGDVLDAPAVAQAVRGQDAVLSALGVSGGSPSTLCSQGVRNILEAMRRTGVRRLVCESAYGASESRSWGAYARFLRIFIRGIMKDKDRMEEIVRASDADWVIVRPPILTNGPRTGTYRIGEDLRLASWFPKVSRADVADWMLNASEGKARARSAPVIAS
jgi:putative NADH-flavin reductase